MLGSFNTEGAEDEEDLEESDDEITEKNFRVLVDVCGDMDDGKQLKRLQILMKN